MVHEWRLLLLKPRTEQYAQPLIPASVCYDSGRGYYKQSGDKLVCQNCGNQFNMDRVEVEAGGCNPWPIFTEDKNVTDDSITISYEFLKESKEIFANWKQSY
ncbi:Fe-S-containing protein [Aminipila sp.]|uniref:Fe-S-containing protein n=1 Tax=Aminipila sp. TaxID=2060095 RepID=UPI00289EA014|nr:Fe-S-containing protein [Aminipila sp.]